MTDTASDVYYDPYDIGINADPYPVYRRLREEAPLYDNETHDFFAGSRFDDVERGLKDWQSFISSKGGIIDPLVGGDRFDFIEHLGKQMPMRVIGMLLGIPEADQEKIRDAADANLRTEAGEKMDFDEGFDVGEDQFAEYIEWRANNPSDDLMTELLNAEFEDVDGTVRTLTREETLLIRSANRDQRRFDDGDTFDIHRETKPHLSFGFGIHYCLGAALARVEGRVALEEALARFPEWEVDLDLAQLSPTSTVRGWESLPARI